MLADRYTLIYVDQVTGEHFNLQRTPVGTFITGTVDGDEALDVVGAIAIDQTLEQIQAAS
jgi:hypothetical protein